MSHCSYITGSMLYWSLFAAADKAGMHADAWSYLQKARELDRPLLLNSTYYRLEHRMSVAKHIMETFREGFWPPAGESTALVDDDDINDGRNRQICVLQAICLYIARYCACILLCLFPPSLCSLPFQRKGLAWAHPRSFLSSLWVFSGADRLF